MAQDYPNISESVSNPLDEARRIIDRDIAQLEESIRTLKSRRNELSPISCLPPEILCHIFSFIEDRTGSLSRRPESWINFSQVSQHWRSLALSAPELWTNIPFRYPQWAEEMLTRSKMATLTIQLRACQLTSSTILDTIKSCLSQMIRLREINISGAPVSVLERLFRDLPKSAPQLHTFHIANHISAPGPALTIHEDFLVDTECLRCVQLVKCKIGWDSRLLTGLTRLTLHDSLKDNANSSMIQFLHALQRMPALIDLDLEDSIPHDTGELSAYPVVDLPCLRVLRISSDVGAVTTALRHITFPSSATLNLVCKDSQSTQSDLSNFLSVLAAKVMSSLVIRSLNLEYLDTASTGLIFQVWSTAPLQNFFPYQYSLVSPHLELVLTWSFEKLRKHGKVLTATFDAMNLGALTQLRLSTANNIDSKTWVQTFGKLPQLERVCVKTYAAYSFLGALAHKTKAADKSMKAYCTVSFPKLRHIFLDGADFADTSLLSIDMLKDCLMERYERNAEVQRLCLDDCSNILEEDVEELREIVVDIDWDGVEQGFSDEYDLEEEEYYDSDGNIIDDDDDLDYYYDDFGGSYHGCRYGPF